MRGLGNRQTEGVTAAQRRRGHEKKGEVKKQMQWAKTRNQECSKYFWKMCAKTRDATIFEKKKQRGEGPCVQLWIECVPCPSQPPKKGKREEEEKFKIILNPPSLCCLLSIDSEQWNDTGNCIGPTRRFTSQSRRKRTLQRNHNKQVRPFL